MSQFNAALVAGDADAMEELFDYESGIFTFQFRDEDVDSLGLPFSSLNMEEMTRVWQNLFSGQEFVNHAGETVPPVTQLQVNRFERMNEWRRPESDMTWFELMYGVYYTNYRVHLSLHRDGGLPDLLVDVLLSFKVRPPREESPFGSDFEGYALFGIVADVWAEEEYDHISFGQLVYMFYSAP